MYWYIHFFQKLHQTMRHCDLSAYTSVAAGQLGGWAAFDNEARGQCPLCWADMAGPVQCAGARSQKAQGSHLAVPAPPFPASAGSSCSPQAPALLCSAPNRTALMPRTTLILCLSAQPQVRQ